MGPILGPPPLWRILKRWRLYPIRFCNWRPRRTEGATLLLNTPTGIKTARFFVLFFHRGKPRPAVKKIPLFDPTHDAVATKKGVRWSPYSNFVCSFGDRFWRLKTCRANVKRVREPPYYESASEPIKTEVVVVKHLRLGKIYGRA